MSSLSVTPERIKALQELRRRRIAELEEEAKLIELIPLPKGQAYKAIAISVDASNVPVEVDVFDGSVLRCTDSEGNEYFNDVVLTDADLDDVRVMLDELFREVSVLQKLLEVLEADNWDSFAPAFATFDPSDFLREMLELGAIISIAERSYKTILLKDGLLRSKLIKPQGKYLEKLKAYFEENCKSHDNYIVGVAKDSAPLRVTLKRLEFKPEYHNRQSFYTHVPAELLEKAYKWRRFREGDIPWGEIYLVRLFAHNHAKIMTIEVPGFLEAELEEVLKVLAAMPLRQIPERFFGFPDPLARAHENTTLRLNVGKAVTREIMQGE